MAAGAEFLAARVQKMEAQPAEERPYDVACYLEAYRLLDAVAEALPMPTAQQVQAGARTADGWAPPQPTPAVPPDALAPTLLRFLRSRYVLRSSVAAHPAGIDTAVCLQLGGLLDVTRLRVDAGGDVIYTYSCGNAIMALAFGEWPDDSLLTLLKALCASALMINDSATASGLASDLATSAAIRLVRPTLAAAYARQLAAGGWESTMGVRELLCLAQDQRFCAFRSCALAGDLEVNPVE